VLRAGQRLRLQPASGDLLAPVAEAARAVSGAAVVTSYLRDEEYPTLLKRAAVIPDDSAAVGSAVLPVSAYRNGIERIADDGGGRTLVVPLEVEGEGVLGLLHLSGVPSGLRHDDRDALAILATQAAIALQNARLHERALAQASEDGLTGLINHRAFQTRLEGEVARTRRSGRPLCLMMIDLDDFRAVNNTYGHQAGDATLQAIAAAIRSSVRASDVAARYGGDEFAVILPETDIEEALDLAHRVLSALAAFQVLDSGVTIRTAASLGVAALPLHADTREELVRAADRAAYAAKRAGKGRVGRPEDAPLILPDDPVALAEQLRHANVATVEALAAAVDAKDPYTRGHSQRVSHYAEGIARALDLEAGDVARIRLAGMLHDVGKIGIPDAILTKPGALSAEEIVVIHQHPAIGERMLANVPFLHDILPAIRHHHERWDGRGYPDGLPGPAIPPDAAVLAVADAFDAMTSNRNYRLALSVSDARLRLHEGAGTQFDPDAVAAFDRAYGLGLMGALSAGNAAIAAANHAYGERELACPEVA